MFTAKLRSVKLMPLRTVEIVLEVPWSHEIPIRVPPSGIKLVEDRDMPSATFCCDRGEWDVRLEESSQEYGCDLAHVKVAKVSLKDDDGEVMARVVLAASIGAGWVDWLHGCIGAQVEVGMVARQVELANVHRVGSATMESSGTSITLTTEEAERIEKRLASLPRRGKTL